MDQPYAISLQDPQKTVDRGALSHCPSAANEQKDLVSFHTNPDIPAHPHITSHSQSTFPAESVTQGNTFFQNAQGVNIGGNPQFHNNIGSITNVYGGKGDGMKHLDGFISYDAQFDSSAQDPDRKCHIGTRKNVLKRLRDWIDNPKSIERIFWLYGPAGAGKSAIAQTIARSYDRPTVAASFFFFRSDVNRNDGNRLFTTLAYQISLSMPEMKEYIARSLIERPDIPRTDVETQFKLLLVHPFRILHEDAARQMAPAIQVIIDIVEKCRVLAPIVIIDGVDECTDENLQGRILKIIGDAVTDDCFPLRFLILSRPEVHIDQTIRRFQSPILTIDLAMLDDANRDIEKYLVDEFSRIASEQGLDPTWPGQEVIGKIVYKSSGNFIYAAVVIRFVGDPYCFAKTQLDIVMNMKQPKMMSPFAILDQLYLEILERVPDQDFLKRYLTLLVARISVSSKFDELYKDDAVLMHTSNEELHANLRRMLSLLKFERRIDVHHKSFIDFLHDSSRSGQYFIPNQDGIRGYLAVFVDSLVRYVSAVIEQPNHRNVHGFTPIFRAKIIAYPPVIELTVEDWQEVMQPLLDLQDELLQWPNFDSIRPFDQVFYMIRELLHLCLHLGFQASVQDASTAHLRKRKGVTSSMKTKTEKDVNDSLSIMLSSLFSLLPETTENYSPNMEAINIVKTVLRSDHANTVRKVRFISDAQKLVDLLHYIIHAKDPPHPDSARKASLLALEIFARVPILPPYYLFDKNEALASYVSSQKINNVIEILAQTIFANGILDSRYIASALFPSPHLNHLTMARWRRISNPSSQTKIQIMLLLADAIQYLHSIGVVLHRDFGLQNVILDSNLCPKIYCWCSTSRSLLDAECKELFSPEENIFSFGSTFCAVYTGVDDRGTVYGLSRNHPISNGMDVTLQLPFVPGILGYPWHLIKRCCVKQAKLRPTIDEVVTEMEEMEGWQMV